MYFALGAAMSSASVPREDFPRPWRRPVGAHHSALRRDGRVLNSQDGAKFGNYILKSLAASIFSGLLVLSANSANAGATHSVGSLVATNIVASTSSGGIAPLAGPPIQTPPPWCAQDIMEGGTRSDELTTPRALKSVKIAFTRPASRPYTWTPRTMPPIGASQSSDDIGVTPAARNPWRISCPKNAASKSSIYDVTRTDLPLNDDSQAPKYFCSLGERRRGAICASNDIIWPRWISIIFCCFSDIPSSNPNNNKVQIASTATPPTTSSVVIDHTFSASLIIPYATAAEPRTLTVSNQKWGHPGDISPEKNPPIIFMRFLAVAGWGVVLVIVTIKIHKRHRADRKCSDL